MWGTGHSQSDWDFILVHSNWNGKSNIHVGNFDITILDINEFKIRLAEHKFLFVICCWLPQAFVWKQAVDPKSLFQFDANKLIVAVLEETERDWKMVSKYLQKNPDRAKKTLVHAFRLLVLTKQIVVEGKVSNLYQVSYPLFQYLVEDYQQRDWSYYEANYSQFFNQFRKDLIERKKK